MEIDKKLLIDGGMSNPLPYDIIQDKCDVTIAIDVSARKDKVEKTETPPSYEILFKAFQIMQNSIVTEKLKRTQPDILITTGISGVRIHEFMKAEIIYKESQRAKDKLKKALEEILESKD